LKSVIKFFLYMGLISLILYTSGCGSEPGSGIEKENKTIVLERTEPTASAGDTLPTVADFVEKTTVVLYFSNGDGKLVAEQREIPKVVGIARETIHQLCAGPENVELEPTLPVGTKLLDINIKDGLCTVDFSGELVEMHSGGSEAEYLTVYSIVNTLTQFSTVEQVQILVEGHIIETIAGHVGVATPLVRDDDIITAL